MLKELTITGYKSYEEATLPLSGLTVLVGTNASGKSNALEVIELLSWVAQGRRLGELPYALGQSHLRIRGKLQDFHPRGAKSGPIRIRAVFAEPTQGAWEPELQELVLDLSFDLDTSGQVRITEETLTAPYAPGGLALYGVSEAARAGGAELQVWYNNFAQGGTKPKIPAIDQQPVFMQLTTPARLASASQKTSARLIPAACQHVRDTLSATILLDPVPSRMREYSYPNESRMQPDGRNLSAVLFHVCTTEPDMTDEVLSFVRNLPDQSIDEIGFVTGPRGEIMVQLHETFGGESKEVEAALLSDGTLRVLAIAATLLSAPQGALVVIEEIDNGVHPSRAQALLERIESIAQRRRLRVLVTTHNPSLMDALADRAMDNAVVCYRDATSGRSKLVRLQDLPRYPALAIQGPLGHLVSKRVLDRYLPGAASDPPDPATYFSRLAGEP